MRPKIIPDSIPGRILAAGALLLAALGACALGIGMFDHDAEHFYGVFGRHVPIAAVYFSGDLGLRFGMGPYVAPALAAARIPVLGISSPTLFATHQTQGDVDRIVAQAVREALRKTDARRIVLIGQSFGSDIVRSGLVHLPAELRARIAAVVLVVPGQTAFYRADPSGLAYLGRPDADASSIAALNWMPLLCIRGEAETDSLCPSFATPNVRTIALPGGHFLRNDHRLLVGTILQQLHPILVARA